MLQDLEDGRLVFFCGAGISYPAGLPGFKRLVDQVYEELSVPMSDVEQAEFCKDLFDRTLGLLEKRIVDRGLVRRAIIKKLQIAQAVELSTHHALLDLAKTADGAQRLVTTNFDRHLHGMIGEHDPDGEGLVYTSADFGAAYLTERWASRFVSDLFGWFTVLFIRGSLNAGAVNPCSFSVLRCSR